MHIITDNVETAFRHLVSGIHSGYILTHNVASRNGEVIMIEEPVILTYLRPTERVLTNPYRDANPFFHLYEALWMLAGRNDVAPLAYYTKRIAQYSDDGIHLNGAYGNRWRYAPHSSDPYENHTVYDLDQLTVLIDHLKSKPESRRAVLQMWNIEDDLLNIDLSKDVCCNLSVCFAVEQGVCQGCNGAGTVPNVLLGDGGYYGEVPCPKCKGLPHDQSQFLNMTVFNRSNDLVLGMLGANAVHFSFLQEYVALSLGLQVGKYHQITNNLHVYTSNWKPEEWLKYYLTDTYTQADRIKSAFVASFVPLVSRQARFDEEVREFVSRHQRDAVAGNYNEPFLGAVAQPMCIAFHHHKRRQYDRALATIETVADGAWRKAGREWIKRRMAKRNDSRRSSPNPTS